MINQPSHEFLMLAATLFESLPPAPESIGDKLLLQLHTIFGPMLMSALQLMDRRDVVCVTLPSNRHIYQVTSAKGIPYTLHVDLPTRTPPSSHPDDAARSQADKSSPRTVDAESNTSTTRRAPDAMIEEEPQGANDKGGEKEIEEVGGEDHTDGMDADLDLGVGGELKTIRDKAERRVRIYELTDKLGGMYCPCAGFAYNTLAGDRNIFCKHLLAVVIAHMTGRAIQTEVILRGVVDLLGLNTVTLGD